MIRRTLGALSRSAMLAGLCLGLAPHPAPASPLQDSPETPAYAKVHAIFARSCQSCHNAKDHKGELTLESYEALMKGGENGPAIVPGKPEESLLLQQIEHRTKPFMPPPKKGKKLEESELGVVRDWIKAGAHGPKPGEVLEKVLRIPKIAPKVPPRQAVLAVAYEPKSNLIALARPGEVELRSGSTRAVIRAFRGHAGPVNAVAFSSDGSTLAAAGGEPGISGEIRLWNVADGKLLKVWKGHEDAIYSLSLAPDGKTFATGSYDHQILLWDRDQEKPLRTFLGHNEAVMGLAFRRDGRILASASSDRTVKLWNVATGERLDTLGESTKALNTVVFSPDGGLVAAGGVDNRIRIWKVSGDAKEGTNPLRSSSFAHEGAILQLAWSSDGSSIASTADDRTVKIWNAATMAPRAVLESQSDWPTSIVFSDQGKALFVGRLDGSFEIYSASSGQVAPAPRPELSAIEPRGIQRGSTASFKLIGKNLSGELKSTDAAVRIAPLSGDRVEITVPPRHPLGDLEFWLVGPGGESGKVKLLVDTLPQREKTGATEMAVELPVSLWGALLSRGQTDAITFQGKKGQTIVVDAAARRIGSKADLNLTLMDASGRLVASCINFEGEPDPLLSTTLPADGGYRLTVADLELGASPNHFYRVSIGDLRVVTGLYPLAVPANTQTPVRLVGVNLPPEAGVQVASGGPGEMAVPVDDNTFRTRRDLRVIVSSLPETLETEDNDRPEHAVRMSAPGAANGRIDHPGDVDFYRFDSKAGQVWVIETQAAQRGAPTDTRIEVLHPDGKPVERVILRAVRDSYLTFRPIDATQSGGRFWHWEEMELGQYLYLNGEVVRLFLAPQGPDSEWKFFSQGGKRRGYFDTSASAHPLDESAYIVEPHPPGTKLPPNGLPQFPVYYENDDDADRKLGSDSKLLFTAPADGAYLVKVRETRGAGGDRYVYRLIIRPATPDFRVSLEGVNPKVPLGSGTSFTVRVDRIDGFDGPVRVNLGHLPEGFSVSTPILIEAGHLEAKGALFAAMDCTPPSPEASARIQITATGAPGGIEVTRPVSGLGALAVAPRPRTVVWLEPDVETSGDTASVNPRISKAEGSDKGGRHRITVRPGGRVSALLKVQRFDHNERVTFDVENLPFGVIVDDIGLSGILIPEGASERRIFINCTAWAPGTERPCYARVREGPNPTSSPVMLEVPRR